MISILKRYRAVPPTALVFLMCASRAWGDWPIAPEDLKMTDLPQQKGAAVVLLREEVANDPENYHSVYMPIKILTEAGRHYADRETHPVLVWV